MQKHRFLLTLAAMLAALLAFSACSAQSPATQQSPEAGAPQVLSAPAEEEQPEAVLEEMEAPAPPQEEAAEPPVEEQVEAPPVEVTPRQGLVASDPTTASLASGQVQFVHFFAFW